MIKKKLQVLFIVLVVAIFASLLFSPGSDSADADKDGISDVFDNCPDITNPLQSDFDGDAVGNDCDPDDDNDGVKDTEDAFDTNATETIDFDNDGIGNNADIDDDNDKIVDALDAFDSDATEWADFDFDGIGGIKDPDDDNDGIVDIKDSDPTLATEDMAKKYLQNMQDCAIMHDDTSRLLCYSQFFVTVTNNEDDNSKTLDLSIALSKLGAIGDCHFVSHAIGHAAFDKNPDVASNLTGMDGTMCRGGYFHGVLESYFHEVKESNESFSSNHTTICNDLIGLSNYQDCIHGLGHGLVHYFGDDLRSAMESCHDMSFYQNILCMKGVMMEYTDNLLTRQGISKNSISGLCNSSELDHLEYQECSMSIGTTLAFFTNHDFDEGIKSCELINNDETQKLCLEGLRLEIEDSIQYEKNPLTQETREKFQPQPTYHSPKIIDIRSPAIISEFNFDPKIKIISFSIDKPQYVILYVPSEFVVPKMIVTVDGKIPDDLKIKNNILGEDVTMIRFVPKTAGTVLITPFS